MKIALQTVLQLLLAVSLLLALTAASCINRPTAPRESYEQSLQRWIGLPSDDLFRSWGLPVRTGELNNGNKLLEYHREVQSGLSKDTCVTLFEINKGGYIIAHYTHGSACRILPAAAS